MRCYFGSTLFLIAVFFGFTHAQTIDSVVEATTRSAGYDSSASNSVQSSSLKAADPLFTDTTKSAPTDQNSPRKLTLVKRKYNSRQQVLLATGMMVFVIGIMTMAQQWNPSIR
jgi:hypothetical protein